MLTRIVHENRPVTLIGGGKVKKSLLRAAIVHAPGVVCADGGARAALKAGLEPLAVIGDFDSIDAKTRAAIAPERLHPVEEQDSTDFEKALRAIEAPLVIGVGFHGGRVDHQLAALHGLLRYPERRVVLLSGQDAVFLLPPELRLDLGTGTRVSLFPMLGVGVRSDGLRWATEGIEFVPGGRIGTSNEAMGPVQLRADGPGMLGIVPVAELARVVEALLGAGAGWPAL
ncbi:thiamine diphosphokinase [Rhodalgimonas zhirmunskyi]|uniref:Thiamine diphosphokinase n=1 Tax=Rhodalgimonas zhirmunskyi TaxID=2964767 RepID=A0AAJ1UEZ3_9RHOB|nr:thiamine diphosphokinase [Rhodoalgimonas zhirmunskyi]MDQ2094842.1 thiamine diphosphokinase [Rhodoalgimonas zhirmunskyi]